MSGPESEAIDTDEPPASSDTASSKRTSTSEHGAADNSDSEDSDAATPEAVNDEPLDDLTSVRSEKAALYVIATPIGNLSDITLRAVDVLKRAALVVAEDTRRSRVLLSHLGITGKNMRCFDAHASEYQVDALVSELAGGRSIALLTDAGTPAVSDPGSHLVRRCHEAGLSVVPIPGPSAVTTALSASGFGDSGFWFLGFLPRKGPKRTHALSRISNTPEAVVLFEAPNRVAATLADLAALMPERRVLIARELTKKFEELRLATLQEAALSAGTIRGEVTLVVAPDPAAGVESKPLQQDLDANIRTALARGEAARDIADGLARPPQLPRRAVYQRVLELRAADEQQADDE